MSKYAKEPKKKRKKRSSLGLILLLTLLLLAVVLVGLPLLLGNDSSATDSTDAATVPVPSGQPTEPTVPAVIPSGLVTVGNGKKEDPRCKAAYTAVYSPELAGKVVASAGEAELTNLELQALYLFEIGSFRASEPDVSPDFRYPLEYQLCPLAEEPVSWQHYFLNLALERWQTGQALLYGASQPQLVTDPSYQPDKPKDNHAEHILPGMPVNDFLYQNRDCYTPNSEHRAWLDGLGTTLDSVAAGLGFGSFRDWAEKTVAAGSETTLRTLAEEYNLAYMYFTELSYGAVPSDEETEAYRTAHASELTAGETTVDIRHVLLTPEGRSEAQWEDCLRRAEELRESLKGPLTGSPEAVFASLANRESEDEGSRLNGGFYGGISRGQLIRELDEWCFDPDRKAGDITVLRTELGYHLVFLSAIRDGLTEAAREALQLENEVSAVAELEKQVPLKPDYSAAALWVDTTAETVNPGDFLYPDIAHQRFPEAIVYLQQDFFYHPWGSRNIGANGCGVATMAMLSTYMTDDLITPPMIADSFSRYYDNNTRSTNADIFLYGVAELGYYLDRVSFDLDDITEALKNGQVVVSLQIGGYFTTSGHYLLVQRYFEEDDTYQVRDSNVFNYGRKDGHNVDRFARWTMTSGGSQFYVMQPKITRIPACWRCGTTFDDHGPGKLLNSDYTCEKCTAALTRRNHFDMLPALLTDGASGMRGNS